MKHRTLRCAAETLVLLLIAVMAVFLAAGLHQRAPDGALSTLSTGWYQLTDGVRREVTLPAALETGPGQTITLYNDTLTDSDGGKVLSARGVEYGIEIRAGETLLYRYEDNAFPKNAQMKGRLWADTELPYGLGGQTLSLTFTELPGRMCRIDAPVLGSMPAVTGRHIQSSLFSAGMILVMLVLAVLALLIFLYMSFYGIRERRFLDTAVFLLLCSLWCLTDSGLYQLYGADTAAGSVVSFYAFMTMAIPMVHFVRNTVSGRLRIVPDVLIALLCVNALAQGAVYRLFGVPFIHMLPLTHLLLTAGVAAMLTVLFRSYRAQPAPQLRLRMAAFAALGAFGVAALVLYWLLHIYWYDAVYQFGVLLFIILLLHGLISQAAEDMRFHMEHRISHERQREDRMTGLPNRRVFEKYGIPLPTDYASFVSACRAFEKHGIRGFDADYCYDYTCTETLQGLSVSELSSAAGRKWRTAYSDPANTEKVGLDDTVWPAAFENLERFIRDTGLNAADLTLNYDDIMDRMRGGKLAMYFGSSMGVKRLADEGIDAAFLPFFGQDGQKWLMTTPYFQVALSRSLEQDSARRAKAMQVLHVMLSEDAQNRIVYEGQDLLSYSQNVSLRLTDYLEDVRPVVEQNHMYIRIASNDFFAVSQDVVSRMIAGEYTAEQAYQAFNAQLLADNTDTAETVLTSDKGYSNVFHADGGNASFSVMANTLRGVYDSDVLIAAANSFTGSVLAADYTEKQAASMIMPNGLLAYRRTMTGAELTETVRAFVEGSEDGFTPFNRGSLPAVSGIAIEVKEENGGFALTGVTRDGKPLQGDETVTVTCLATAKQMAPLLADDSRPFEGGETRVRDTWSAYAAGGSAALAEPEHYITLR